MAIRTLVTRGFGNGTFNGTIALVTLRGYLSSSETVPDFGYGVNSAMILDGAGIQSTSATAGAGISSKSTLGTGIGATMSIDGAGMGSTMDIDGAGISSRG